ncbi:tRNA (adenosine(37)-N6)-threonylcarbamoyltransferase complex dimerization subunit type 1 TsaB [Solimonas sp. SE-A11]|uniref:tRNA (adenosine(37)-N6)-threonylcarbamoyltransferase complex dimerization subunit type 1 TsaB n=1 Tax=Solimonas sp. SE-A11 TaxID=3054954 RepID=UPI00259C7210|nr:tRNA (adenosine(37)-N6)-threonylcarbamoyltransferase complex dimerization subunit type 1 TsaB [Solimonas sp. SE-A11]MDM4770078.1 tRNA (adenosine(37)-N6)-threonylcarbamoyltransferase complex dimerization subunit type 1 TsaB [Solimonas sp. SE-A11]
MKILALDTATEACSVALSVDGRIEERFETAGRSHTERMMPMVQELMAGAGLAFSQLDGIACGIGPGSFAGVRIGVGFVKGLSLALDRPVVGVSSLPAMALRAIRGGATQVLAAIDARMNEVYWGAYVAAGDGRPRALREEGVCAPAEVPAVPAGDWTAAGTGWGAYPEVLPAAFGVTPSRVVADALPHAEDILRLALPQFQAGQAISGDLLLPVYLRNKVALTLVEQAALRAGR